MDGEVIVRTDNISFKASYQDTLVQTLIEAVEVAAGAVEPITLVFAKHNDISMPTLMQYFNLFDESGRIAFGGVGYPRALPALQVADIVAYEISREARTENKPTRKRYPFCGSRRLGHLLAHGSSKV